jgi:hypothetical protein
MQRKFKGHSGPLFWAVIIFTTFVTFGLIYGLTHQGDKIVALWEVRTIYYLPALFILTSNLIKTRRQVNVLIWIIIIAIFFDSLNGAWFVIYDLDFNLGSLEAIAEHSYSIHLNTLLILTACVWLFRASWAKRITLPMMLPIVLISYFANQRRASYITLAVALCLLAFLLYRENHTAFWLIIPLIFLVSVVYIAAFWNSSGSIGGPARAIRSIIAPVPGGRDDASNEYRILENINTKFTIQAKPLTGVGFGNKFYIIVPMPDISFFVWWEYITHNSILWIWMQMGVGGFVATLFMVGSSIMTGVRVLLRMPGGDLSAIALMATLYIVMHFIFAYVDMSWDAQSMFYIGTMMGILNSLERIVAAPDIGLPKRWPWQAAPVPPPGLRPLS